MLQLYRANCTTVGRKMSLDIVKFSDESFKAEQYVHSILTQSSEEGVRSFHQALVDAGDAAAADLQRNVYKNYSEFVLISKEISRLETDMWSLRGLLADFTDVNQALLKTIRTEEPSTVEKTTETSQDQDLNTRTATPSSTLAAQSETQNRISQLSTLYDTIEGLSKILPPSPLRYLVRDGSTSRFGESNPSNMNKVLQSVYFYILSDTLVVTTKKRGIISGKNKMVLDKCWSLGDVAIIDVKDSTEVSNAFKILRHPDTFIYRSDTLEEKRSFLTAFKRYTDELMLQKRAALENAKNKQPSATPLEEVVSPTQRETDREERARRALRDDLSNAEVKWLMELSDELDVLVAHRDFDVAVGLIEDARRTLSKSSAETPRVAQIKASLEERTNKLAQLVSMDFANPVATKSQVQANIDKLLRLGMGDQARDFFLTSRTAIIRHRIRLVRFGGDVSIYISDLAQVVFRLTRNTCDWYGGSFRDTTMASGFMKWVAIELENFTQIFRRQVFDCHPSFSVIADCLQHTLEHCKPLKEVGLHIAPMITDALHDDIVRSIEEHSASCVANIVVSLEKDKFVVVDANWLIGKEDEFADITAKVSQSVYELYSILMDFGSDVSVLMSISLYNKIVTCLTDFFSAYVEKLIRSFGETNRNWTYGQRSVMMVNSVFIVDDLLPKVAGQLARRFDRAIPEMEDMGVALKHRVTDLHHTLFIDITHERLTKELWNFPTIDYTSNGGILDSAKPSDNMMRLVEELNKILGALSPTLPRIAMLSRVIDLIFTAMDEPQSWVTPRNTPRRFGFHGVQQLILDINFFLRICEPLVSDRASEAANRVCEKGLRTFFSGQGASATPGGGGAVVKAALKTGDWYDQRVDSVMDLISSEFPHLVALRNASSGST
ncbi:uncharacterized protein EV422DRAFT_533391 [Fimicolochytrium jonesii]|uniref:uncharacterized protein n=1 Tax=Fimicolochytrium jonesii TaxID=1396493 RepID=UPI0022FE7D67|nr:uncharacterized protein EV422DRAFT_533391 [Fimicolochytrium jonesii]KAI8819537.1 hypothetical protein EV422DRAFT_533391 [Fimicolochytrium jonesii]